MNKTVSDVCATEWLDITEAPDNFSFRCLIKFQEHGLMGPDCPYISTGTWCFCSTCSSTKAPNGPDCPYISTGTWWHRDMLFTIDMPEYRKFTPIAFIPLYDQIT